MTPREKLLKIAAKVHTDAANHREYAASLDVSALHIDSVIESGTDEEVLAYLQIIMKECPELKAEVSLVAEYTGPHRLTEDETKRVAWNTEKLKRDNN